MTTRDLDCVIDRFSERLQSAGLLVASIDSAPWIDSLEQRLPKRLPRSFISLVKRYAFRPFEWGPVSFFGNSSGNQESDFPAAVLHDSVMWNTALSAGFIYFAHPAGGSYDAICFDTRASRGNSESRIVRLDHESILTKEKIDIREEIASSFVALVELLLASGSEPIAD